MRGKNEKKEKEAQASDYYLIYAESNIYTFMNDIHIKKLLDGNYDSLVNKKHKIKSMNDMMTMVMTFMKQRDSFFYLR